MWNETDQETPLVGLYQSGNAPLRRGSERSVALIEEPFVELVTLRGDATSPAFCEVVREQLGGLDLPVAPNTVADGDEYSALWLAPDEWLLRANRAGHSAVAARLDQALAERLHSTSDQSSGYSVMRLYGPNARFVLNKGCPLDLHPTVFKPGQCAQSHYFKTSVLLRPRDGKGEIWEIIVRRSFADYAARMLLEAMED